MRVSIIFILLMLVSKVYASEVILKGVYKGKNLYVQNPLLPDGTGYCTQDVYVNEKLVFSKPKRSSFMIDLSFLAKQTPVTIKITHSSGCRPKVINARAIDPALAFSFTNIGVDDKGVKFQAVGEQSGSTYTIQKYVNHTWEDIKKISGGTSNYNVNVTHSQGDNIYRVKYIKSGQKALFSSSKTYNSSNIAVKFYPKNVTKYIFFTETTPYEILNSAGKTLKKGTGKKVDVSTFPRGVYYLNINQKTEKFLKK